MVQENKIVSKEEKLKSLREAGNTSVLACLQSSIQLSQIRNQVKFNMENACRRLAGLRFIDSVLKVDMDKKSLFEVISWMCTLQPDSTSLFHYLDGVKGCGHVLEEQLRTVFFDILGKFTERLKSTKDPQEAKTIMEALHWNFKSRDFKLLNEKLQIFDLLYRGNGDKDSVIGRNFHNYFLKKADTLSKDLLFTFEDAFLAVVARITDTESLQTLQLKSRG